MQSNLLLCELHAHTTWSDGFLTMTELVDLYGRNGFDVLCVTDHLLRSDSTRFRLRPQTHALCSVDDGLEPAMRAARDAGAAIVAATPTASGTIRAAGAPPAGFPGTGSGWTASSTATSSSTAGRRSGGSPRPGCRGSQPATSTGSSTYGPGRRCCPAPRTSRP